MVLFVVGIPGGILIALYMGQRSGTLEYPSVEVTNDDFFTASELLFNVHRTNAYFRNRVAFGNVYLNYDAECWWFEFACTMRKLMLTGALVVFGAGTTPQIVFAIIVCILWLTLVSNYKPVG